MKTFNAIIVDKEIESARLLSDLLDEFGNIKIISIEKDSSIALSKILHLKPDLLFLGIEMPVLNGFDIIHRLKENMFLITSINLLTFWKLKNVLLGLNQKATIIWKNYQTKKKKSCIYCVRDGQLNR